MIKGFKVRIYPTKEQEKQIWKHINCSRFVWNYMLAEQEKKYKATKTHLTGFEMSNLLTKLKHEEEYRWLSEVSASSIQKVCRNLWAAYQNFFNKKCKVPKFKSKKYAKPTYSVAESSFKISNGVVYIQKIGFIKYKSDLIFEENKKYKNVKITFVDGKYMLSFSCECENQALTLNKNSIGIDVGIKELAVVAFGDKKFVFHNINKSKKIKDIEKQIQYHQRKLSHKLLCSPNRRLSNNAIKEQKILKRLYMRMSNIRTNYLHQVSHAIVSLAPKKIIMEDIKVKSLLKNRIFNKYIYDQKLNEFIFFVRYKCEWHEIEFVKANRNYPSSKTCSNCGNIKKDLKLSDRTYVCDCCGLCMDRDYNAAINLMRYKT